MLALRSALYNLIQWITVSVYATLTALTFPFPLKSRYRFASQWARLQVPLARALCGIRYRVEGREHLPKGPAIILSKHQSAWETMAFQVIFPPHTWVVKRELMWIPFFGWGLAALKPIAIDRGAGRKSVEQIVEQGRARLKEGVWIVVFPEGTRVAPGHRRRYGIGGAALAAATGYPVVPVAHNAGTFWPRRGFLKKPGTIRVVIGPTIHTHGKSAEEINKRAEEWIEGKMGEIEKRDSAA